MKKAGLVSVTFRKLSVKDIINLVREAGLDGIEWGGDIHVPHGNLVCAQEVNKMTTEAGLQIAAYGSYYYVGCEGIVTLPFEKVLDTAVALHAPIIRVWAGNKGHRDADEKWCYKVAEDARHIAALAFDAGIKISFEYHVNTLTDSVESAYKLLKDINHPNIYTYWQPPVGLNVKACVDELKQIMPWLTNIHVFQWMQSERKALADGIDVWKEYIAAVDNMKDGFYLLEFVKEDAPDQFLKDAKVLKNLIKV